MSKRFTKKINVVETVLKNFGVTFVIIHVILLVCFSTNTYAQSGLKAEYYDGANFERLVATRIESKIDQSWNRTPPVAGIDPHVCSIRWTGKLRPSESGSYTFSARVDDGIRVWVNDELVIDDWQLNDVGLFNGTIDMTAGKYYDLKVEYFNALIEGEIRLLWEIPTEKKWYQILAKKNYEVIRPEFFFQPNPTPENDIPDEDILAAHDSNNSIPTEPNPTTLLYKPKKKKRIVDKILPEPPVDVNAKPAVEEEVTPEVVEKYTPNNILFERAKVIILHESYLELDRFAEFMINNPDLTVKIEGHTDPIGNETKNFELSERRAYAIARYLVKKEVAASRIKAEGFGGTKPLVIPEDGKYFPGNRRVEFIVSDGVGQLLTAR